LKESLGLEKKTTVSKVLAESSNFGEGKRPMKEEMRILVGENGNEDALDGKQLIY